MSWQHSSQVEAVVEAILMLSEPMSSQWSYYDEYVIERLGYPLSISLPFPLCLE